VSNELQRLTNLLEGMSLQQKRSLLDYAEFLKQKSSAIEQVPEPEEKLQPQHTLRPENENIINAIKRLRATYHMLNTDSLLNETSSLMTQHIVHGREASDVIDELEILFDYHFNKYLES